MVERGASGDCSVRELILLVARIGFKLFDEDERRKTDIHGRRIRSRRGVRGVGVELPSCAREGVA
jgi:hypothetical protein